jgi:hypothetical protein
MGGDTSGVEALTPDAGFSFDQPQPVDVPDVPAANLDDPYANANALAAAYSDTTFIPTKVLPGGNTAESVMLGSLSNGQEVVRKGVKDAIEADKEYLAGRVLNQLGVTDINTIRPSERVVVSEYIRGLDGVDWSTTLPSGTTPSEYWSRLASMKGGRETGLFDFISSNTDRHVMNFLVKDDTLYPIDHGNTLYSAESVSYRKVAYREGRIASYSLGIVDDIGEPQVFGVLDRVDASVSWTKAELESIRNRIVGMKDEYAAHLDWHQYMLDRLDYLIEETPWK